MIGAPSDKRTRVFEEAVVMGNSIRSFPSGHHKRETPATPLPVAGRQL
jgi:hypothetical protein